MSESLPSNDPEVQKRRSTRIAQSVPITVIGVDALGQAFKERTSTVSVNCHGCKYQSKHYVPKTAQVTIEIARGEADAPPRMVEGRVAWVQRPRTVRELFQIGVEFTTPGNVWGIAFPPADWFPLPGDAEKDLEIPLPAASAHAPKKEEPSPAALDSAAAPKKSEPAKPAEIQATPQVETSKVRVLPTPTPAAAHSQETPHETMSAARQMARLLAEAKQHLRRTMETGAAEAVTKEVRTAREQVELHLRTAVNDAVENSVAKVAEKSVEAAVQNAVEKSLHKLVEQATQQVVHNALAAFEKARAASTPKPEDMDANVRAAVERVVKTSAAKLAEETIHQSVQHSVEQAVKQATANLPLQTATAAASTEEALRQLDQAAQSRFENWRKEFEQTASDFRTKSLEQLAHESSSATQKWREQFDAALTGASEQMNEKLNQLSQAATARAEQEISARGASLQTLLNDAALEAQKNLDSLGAGLEEKRQLAESAAVKAEETARRAEETSAQIEAMSRASYDEARKRLDDLLTSQSGELDRRADELIQQKADQSLQTLTQKLEEQLAPHYQRAQEMSEQLQTSNRQAEGALQQFRSQMHEVSEQALSAALDRMRQQTAELPAEFEQKCHAALSKLEEELETKSTDASHTTFEALYKASEWYQKKAQAGMQSALEKVLEQSTGNMRDRAAELSRMFASELDHCSRSYVEHAQGMMEESAKEINERTRQNLTEIVQTISATATDELSRIARENLTRFEEAAGASAQDAKTRMSAQSNEAMAEFENRLEERMVQGAAQARRDLEEQLKPLVEQFYSARDEEQGAWLERMKATVEESIVQYKDRLENASNSWLLASATMLGQHSKGVLDTLSHAAEERLRDTCSDVFANLGETLRARLLGLSTDVAPAKKPPEKK